MGNANPCLSHTLSFHLLNILEVMDMNRLAVARGQGPRWEADGLGQEQRRGQLMWIW